MEGNVQFSIYKIDLDEAKKYIISVSDESNTEDTTGICKQLINYFSYVIENIRNSEQYIFDKAGYVGIIYKTYHDPDWSDMALELIEDANLEIEREWFTNVNVSYILLYALDRDIYAMTGGFGNHIIKKCIERNWGLHLLPKIEQKNSGIIRHLKEHNITGNALSASRANRKMTNFSMEEDMSKIFREMSVEIDNVLARNWELGMKMHITVKELQ